MIKCLKSYVNDMRTAEIAKSVDGEWYAREYVFNYNFRAQGWHWSKWKHIGKVVEIKHGITRWQNLNGNEVQRNGAKIKFNKYEFYLKAGLMALRECSKRYRLPKINEEN